MFGLGSEFLRDYGKKGNRPALLIIPAAPMTELVPTSPAIPAATEKKRHNDNDYEKRGGIHSALLRKLSR